MTIEPKKLKARCPHCKEWTSWAENPHRPFCSAFCKDRDLGNWAAENYRIADEGEAPGGPASDEE